MTGGALCASWREGAKFLSASDQTGLSSYTDEAVQVRSAAIGEYLRAAIAPNTERAYRADLEHFVAWGGTIPASDAVIAAYLAEHAAVLAVSTLVRRLAAISKVHRLLGLSAPTTSDLVRTTLRGIRRTRGKPKRQVTAAVKEDVLAMVARLGDSPKGCRDKALLLIGFAGAFRRSELGGIDVEHIEHVP